MTKKCPRCNKEFECKHSATCWCSKYSISDNVRLFLKDNFSDCLCEDCLKEIIKLHE